MFNFSTQKNIKEDPKTPEGLCAEAIRGFKEKSDHSKRESMLCFWFSMGGAFAAPIFVTLGEDITKLFGESGSPFIFAKLVPILLSAAVAFSTAWLQLRKPQQLWAPTICSGSIYFYPEFFGLNHTGFSLGFAKTGESNAPPQLSPATVLRSCLELG